ncbi:MAG: hypothetical protein E6Q67_05710 [Roseateles sp.]|nr:MAG: hypothetical protein E6Q67_05710 [Roseateles sp.]
MLLPVSRPSLPTVPALLGAPLLASLGLLSACGGGGSSADVATPPPVTPSAAIAIDGRAVDGPLAGATACYDLNDNGSCDNGEPSSAPTGADGSFSLSVAAADAGRHRIVVMVPATAVDAATGAAVGTAYVLQAPATGTATAHSVFVSPLTTLVQGHVDATGASLAEAVSLVTAQAGLGMSPLADFTAASGPEAQQAALVARLVQATRLAQAELLKPLAGQTDLSGAAIAEADLQKQLSSALIAALPHIAGKSAEPALSGASGSALTSALADAAQAVIAQAGLDADSAKAAIGAARLPADTSPASTTATAQLTALRYVDANNWFMRSLQSSVADNTPDAAGLVRYAPVYLQSQSSGFSAAGVTQGWAHGSSYARRGDLHWNGSAWQACRLGDRGSSTLRDAQGRASYNYCDGIEKGRTWRSAVDLAGLRIADVFRDRIRPYPGGTQGVAYASWGPSDLGLFGSASFPTGAKLHYQTNTVTETALAYDPQPGNVATAYEPAVAAGGDSRSTAGLACAGTTSASTLATLEDLVARNPGKPCVFAKAVSGSDASLDPNEWWSNSTASLAVLSDAATRPAGTGAWYSTDLRLRVAFEGGDSKATRYYSCLSRASSGSARNCSLVGSGSYKVQTLGDARVMSFSGLPALMQKAGFQRVFVERGGQVYLGFQTLAGASTSQLRLNLEAANAVLAALPGMPAINPTTRHADLPAASQAALATARGVWLVAADDGSEFSVLRIGEAGRYLLGAMGPQQTASREQSGHELGWMDYDAATQTFRALVEGNSELGRGLMLRSLEEQRSERLAISDTVLSSSLGDRLTRLPNEPGGLVGLWAVGSATELNTQHFAFLPNGRVLMIDPLGDTQPGACLSQRKGPPGAEYARYSYDAASGALTVFDKLYDTNGCAGFFDQGTQVTLTLRLASDGQSATVTAPDGDFTLYRIAP